VGGLALYGPGPRINLCARRGYVAGAEAMMNPVKLARGPVRSPLVNVTGEGREELRQTLETWSPLLRRAPDGGRQKYKEPLAKSGFFEGIPETSKS
jgi:hypothetical protein